VVRKDGNALFRRFKPDIEGLHPSLQLASKVNCAFVFRKGNPDAWKVSKRSREDGEPEPSDAALRAAARARVSEARGTSGAGHRNGDLSQAAQNGSSTSGAQGGTAANRGVQGLNANTGPRLSEVDDLFEIGGAVGQERNDAEHKSSQQSAYKRSSKFKRAR
jgi:hypothetical protein